MPNNKFPDKVANMAPIHAMCNICGKRQAIYDAPTYQGPWAHLCTPCYRKWASASAHRLGTRIIEIEVNN